MVKATLVKAIIFFGIVIYGVLMYDKLHKSYLSDQEVLIDYILELEESVVAYQDSLENIPEPIVKVVKEEVTVLQIDSILVNSTGKDINELHEIKFSLIDKYEGTFFQVEGVTAFKWDYLNNVPLNPTTSLINSKVSLNLETSFSIKKDFLSVEVLPLSPNVIISDINKATVDLGPIHKPKPVRWGMGLIGGYGFTSEGFTPFVGFGITYTFKGLE